MNEQLTAIVANQPYPLLFATISGAHLYGFPSPDSDYDLRGVHILPVIDVVGLEEGQDTIQISELQAGIELDLVTHDIKKFFQLLLRRNGYVLEQLYSPLVVHTNAEHQELKTIAEGCITRHHNYHYQGFAKTQWQLFVKENPHRVKPLLYTFRVLLTGIHLMETGRIEANLVILNDIFKLPYIPELIQQKLSKNEQTSLVEADLEFYQSEYERLQAQLENAHQVSQLPEASTSHKALNDLLVRIRLGLGNSRFNRVNG